MKSVYNLPIPQPMAWRTRLIGTRLSLIKMMWLALFGSFPLTLITMANMIPLLSTASFFGLLHVTYLTSTNVQSVRSKFVLHQWTMGFLVVLVLMQLPLVLVRQKVGSLHLTTFLKRVSLSTRLLFPLRHQSLMQLAL